jgi:hypothetical protein
MLALAPMVMVVIYLAWWFKTHSGALASFVRQLQEGDDTRQTLLLLLRLALLMLLPKLLLLLLVLLSCLVSYCSKCQVRLKE